MKTVCFDAKGEALWAAEGEEIDVIVPPGCVTALVSDEVDINTVYFDGMSVIKKTPLVALTVDKTMVGLNEAATVTVPANGMLVVNGETVTPTDGKYILRASQPKTFAVQLVGAVRSEPVIVEAIYAADVEASLISQIDTECERRVMLTMTRGGGKKYSYNRKAAEVETSKGVLPTVLNALSLVDRQKKYPFAAAEMALSGETLSAVLARFAAGTAVADSKVAAIEAAAVIAKRALRAATNLSAKRAAAVVAWPA